MAKDGGRPSNPTMAFDGYVVRTDGYGSLRKREPPIKQRPPPPAPMMSKPTKSEGTKKPPGGRK